MTNSYSAQATCATLTLGEEKPARAIADLLAESFDADIAAVAVFETAPGRWDVSVYFGDAPDETAIRTLVTLAAGEEYGRALAFAPLVEKDWVRASLDGLPPVTAGRFLVHGAHDRASVKPNMLGIEIEAALAFGTGHHGTTRGCLLLLDEVLRRKRPQRVLDLGTGSGVLAIAAAKALKQRIKASDIDLRSAITAQQNARLNEVGPLIRAVHAPGFASPALQGRYDLVMANILAGPLKRLAAPMAAHLAPGATVILSGLLPPHVNGVLSAYRDQGLRLIRRLPCDGWVSLLLQRNSTTPPPKRPR